MSVRELEHKYIDFVKSVLSPDRPFPKLCGDDEWMGLFSFCQKQTITGIVFDSLQRYYETVGKSIPSVLTLEWYAQAAQIRQRNLLINKRCGEVSAFFKDSGLQSCILKGQGNATMYPNPLLRMPGDIDIWVEGTRKEIKQVVFNKVGKTFEITHHIAFPLFEDADVEVHFTPGDMCNPFNDRILQKYYLDNRAEQMDNSINLEGADTQVCIPLKGFNAIFELSHIMYHFFIEGVGLRHFMDYYYLLLQGFSSEERMEYEKQINRLGMTSFAESVMWIEKEVLGLDDEYLLLPTYEKGGKLILEEVIATGNMGHYDTRYPFRKRGIFARGMVDAYRSLQLARVFPSEGLWKLFQKIVNQRWKIKDYFK